MFLSGVASSRASKKKLTKLVTKKRKKFKKLEKKNCLLLVSTTYTHSTFACACACWAREAFEWSRSGGKEKGTREWRSIKIAGAFGAVATRYERCS
jgi:hypothetical protein